MKLGRWQARSGNLHNIDRFYECARVWKWEESTSGQCWDDQGMWQHRDGESRYDLVRYLSPLELSPTPACADQAGTPVVSTVSTETAGEQLRRMRDRFVALQREVRIYSALLPELERAMSDLEERIKAMEKEHDL